MHKKQTYKISGMTCTNCKLNIEKAVKKLNGVDSANVNFVNNTMVVEGDIHSSFIIKAVKSVGYGAQIIDGSQSKIAKNSDIENKIKTLIISIILILFLMYFSMGISMLNLPVPYFLQNNFLGIEIFQMLIALLIIFVNRGIIVGGIKALLNFSANMNSLVALGSCTSFFWSFAILISHTYQISNGMISDNFLKTNNIYFESSAMILVIVSIGKLIESKSKFKTNNAVNSLKKIIPNKIEVERNNKLILIDLKDLKIGDIFVVKAGEAIVADAKIIKGTTSVDESNITGESMPKNKLVGDSLISGTINLTGYIKCEAQKVGADTTISKIIASLDQAIMSKAPIEKIADKISKYFIPVIITLSLVTLFIWLLCGATFDFAINRAISVLVISCPCALGLATPLAIMVGCGKGAKNGVLYKNAQVLEYAGKTKIIAFDKTGTITKGKPEVKSFITFNNSSKIDVLSKILALEKSSNHPISNAINKYAEKFDVLEYSPENLVLEFGKGIKGTINKKNVFVGSYDFAKDFIRNSDIYLIEQNKYMASTMIYFVEEDVLLGQIEISDMLKDDAICSIEKIKNNDMIPVIISGDNYAVTKSVCKKINIKNFFTNVLPNKKSEIVNSLKKFDKTAFVGDGINDSVALTSSDIGIAIGSGADIAIESADIVIMNNSIYSVYYAIMLSKEVSRNIKQNLFWALFYNCLCIPIAAGCLYPICGFLINPMISAAAMSISSICVVLNSLRLNRFNADKNFVKIKNADNSTIEINIEKLSKKYQKNLKEDKISHIKTLRVDGMMCNHCASRVKDALENIATIYSANVNLEEKTVDIICNEQVSDEQLRTTITNLSFVLKHIKDKEKNEQ